VKTTEPTVAAVLTFYRNEQFIADAVASVLSQTRPPDEIIVVNDCSPSGTADVLDTLPSEVRVVHHTVNTGVGGARQTGVDATRSSCVAFLDGDDLWEARKLERMLAYWAVHPEADVLHSGTTTFDRAGPVQDFLHKPTPLTLPAQLRWNRILMQTAMIPRAWLERVGPFKPRRDIVPDWDYDIRLVLAGARVECVPEPLTRVRRFRHFHISSGGYRQIRRRTATLRAYWPEAVAAVGHRESCRIFAAIIREEGWKISPPFVRRSVVATAWAIERMLTAAGARGDDG
jgi:glycosyltransferase involved in cell wall biosynthesis